MVLPGQYLERPTLVRRETAGGAVALDALYHRGTKPPALLVCAPHPLLGGSMDSPVVAEIAWAATRRGHATLRFNYQGVGASGGARHTDAHPLSGPRPLSALAEEIADASAAAGHLAETVGRGRPAGVAAAGYSFGAAVALGLALQLPAIEHLVLVAPPTRLFDFSAVARVDRPLLIVHGSEDPLVDPGLAGWLSTGARCRVDVLEESDHALTRGLTEVGRRVAQWLDERSSAQRF